MLAGSVAMAECIVCSRCAVATAPASTTAEHRWQVVAVATGTSTSRKSGRVPWADSMVANIQTSKAQYSS